MKTDDLDDELELIRANIDLLGKCYAGEDEVEREITGLALVDFENRGARAVVEGVDDQDDLEQVLLQTFLVGIEDGDIVMEPEVEQEDEQEDGDE